MKYVDVRRSALCDDRSVDLGTRWAVFEPNSGVLLRRLRLPVVMPRARRELPGVTLERDRVDLPTEGVVPVPLDDDSVRVELDGLGADGQRLIVGAVPVGVVEEGLDAARLLAPAHVGPAYSRGESRSAGCRPPRGIEPLRAGSKPAALP